MALGKTLRSARLAKGLSPEQVAGSTRMMVQMVEEIESEDFHRFAAPIYGKGFIRLFAQEVGVPAEPLVREYLEHHAVSGLRLPEDQSPGRILSRETLPPPPHEPERTETSGMTQDPGSKTPTTSGDHDSFALTADAIPPDTDLFDFDPPGEPPPAHGPALMLRSAWTRIRGKCLECRESLCAVRRTLRARFQERSARIDPSRLAQVTRVPVWVLVLLALVFALAIGLRMRSRRERMAPPPHPGPPREDYARIIPPPQPYLD